MKIVAILLIFSCAALGQIRGDAFDTPTKYEKTQLGFYLNHSKQITWNISDKDLLHLARWHFLDKTRKSDIVYIPVKWVYTDSLFYKSDNTWPPFAPFSTRTVLKEYVADVHDPVIITYRTLNLKDYPKVIVGKPQTTGSLVNIDSRYKVIDKVTVKKEIEKKLNSKTATAEEAIGLERGVK